MDNFLHPKYILQYSLEKFGRPKYTNGNSLVSSGEDIRLLGSLYEYYFDVIYLTWGFDILMIIFGSNKVWYGYLIIPGFAIYKLSNFIYHSLKRINQMALHQRNNKQKLNKPILLLVNVNKIAS